MGTAADMLLCDRAVEVEWSETVLGKEHPFVLVLEQKLTFSVLSEVLVFVILQSFGCLFLERRSIGICIDFAKFLCEG